MRRYPHRRVGLRSAGAAVLTLTTVAMLGLLAPASAADHLASDDFTRAVSGGWGRAQEGGNWAFSRSSRGLQVARGRGRLALRAGSRRGAKAVLSTVAARDVAASVDVHLGGRADDRRVARGLVLRSGRGGEYRATVRPAGSDVRLTLTRVTNFGLAKLLAARTVRTPRPDGRWYRVRAEVIGDGDTVVRAKVWPVTQTEPVEWQLQATARESTIDSDGAVGVVAETSDALAEPAVLEFDNFKARHGKKTTTIKPPPTEPTEPTPTEPTPTEPAPSEPTPTEPTPTEPGPSEPAPTEPAPTEPAPSEPAPTPAPTLSPAPTPTQSPAPTPTPTPTPTQSPSPTPPAPTPTPTPPAPTPSPTPTPTVSLQPSLTRTAGALPLGTAQYPVPTGARFVATTGNNAGAGTVADPWRTLAHAVQYAPAGATIVVRGGTYHDTAVFPYGKRLTVQNYPGEAVWLDGSQPVTGWSQVSPGVWRVANWNFLPDTTDPTASYTDPSWRMVTAADPMAAHPDMVFYDGVQLRQVASASAVVPGTFFVDRVAHTLSIGSDPTAHLVEAATRTEAIYVNRGAGSVIRGIGIRRYATPLNRYGAVKAFADGVVVENVHVLDTATRGIGIDGRGVIVRAATVSGHGQLGIGANASDELQIIQSVVARNNLERFNTVPVAGGVKITRSRHVDVRGSIMRNNLGRGLWIDESCYAVRMVDNRIEDNVSAGLHFEISGHGLVFDNLITGNERTGLLIADSNDVDVWNNTIVGNGVRNLEVIDGSRVNDGQTAGRDPRYPMDPDVTWVVERIAVRNNIFATPRAGATALVGVEDATRTRPAAAMASFNANGYLRSSTSQPGWVANWANYGATPAMLVFPTLAGWRTATGQELLGVSSDSAGTQPWFRDAAAGDYRLTSTSPARGAGLTLPLEVGSFIEPITTPDIGKLRH